MPVVQLDKKKWKINAQQERIVMQLGTDRDSNPEQMAARYERLAYCCSSQTPITLILPESEAVSKGFFQRIDKSSLTVRLAKGQKHDFADRFCCATFFCDDRRWTFFSNVYEVNEEFNRELVLEVPARIMAERRFLQRPRRISVKREDGFGVNLRCDNKQYNGRVVNINSRGALVEFEEMVDVKLETLVQLELCLDESVIAVPAFPVRRERSRLGFAFEADCGGEWQVGLKTMIQKTLTSTTSQSS